MTKLPDRIDKDSLERIIKRAAELQTRERDLSEGLTEEDLLSLGDDVGIPRKYIQQALWEQKTSASPLSSGLDNLLGPDQLASSRTVLRDAPKVREEIAYWMTGVELLTVKRRYPDATSWEPRNDVFTTVRMAFGVGGRSYALAKARQVAAQVIQLEPGACHVTLTADVSNKRTQRAWGASVLTGVGAAAAGTGLALGFLTPVALAALPLGALAGFGVAKSGRRELDRISVALEQILDRLQHGEIQLPAPKQKTSSSLLQIADEIKDEIKKNLNK